MIRSLDFGIEYRRFDLGLPRRSLDLLELACAVRPPEDLDLLLNPAEQLLGELVGGVELDRHLELVPGRLEAAEFAQHGAALEVPGGRLLTRKGQIELVLGIVRFVGQSLEIEVDRRIPVLRLEGLFAVTGGLLSRGAPSGKGHEGAQSECRREKPDSLVSHLPTVHVCPPGCRSRQNRSAPIRGRSRE